MDLDNFVQSIKSYCLAKGVKPTVACREAGVGQSFINNMELKRSVPSVEKVQTLARYLGVTTSELLGEVERDHIADRGNMVHPNPRAPADLQNEAITLHDSAVRLKVDEVDMIMAYRKADSDTKVIVDTALRRYKGKEKSATHEAG